MLDSLDLNPLLIAPLLIPISLHLYYLAVQRRKYHPGPLQLPLIGNLLQVPRETPWLTYQEWSKVYGSCIHLNVAGLKVLVINDFKDAEMILTKRGLNNAERPHLVMAGDLVGFGRGLALLPYEDDAKEARKLIHLTVGAKYIPSYHDLLESETLRYLRGLRTSPEKAISHLSYTAGAIILKIAYGYDVTPTEDPLVALANDALDKFSRTTLLGEFAVDLFPSLLYLPSWFPGGNFKNLAKEWSQLGKDLFDKPFNHVKNQMGAGIAPQSFSSRHLEKLSEWDDDKIGSSAEVIKLTATSLYAGASDTTVSAMRSFLLAMTIYPDVQRKAQGEIDNVVGPDRLPGFADRPLLPYCDRIMKEVLRWGAIGPLGVPHVAKEDDVFEGYNIEKGTILVPNIWAMLHEESTYPNPDTFNPDRFLDPSQPDSTGMVFGFGRRACPGSQLALASLSLMIMQTLSTFTVTRALDSNGREIIPKAEFVTGTISHPKSFEFVIKPRLDRMHLLD